MQMLVGVKSANPRGGDYALATFVNGKNTQVNLRAVARGQLELSIDASGGGQATTVVAAGNADNPPSLTAVADGSVVVIDTVQPLHPAASPQFQALSLSGPPVDKADAVVGWRKQDGQLVLTQAAAPTDVTRWPMRYVSKVDELALRDGDMVLAVLLDGTLNLPNPRTLRIGDGRIVVITNVTANRLAVNGLTVGTDTISIGLARGQSVTLASAANLPFPGWLVIGRA